MTREEIIKHLHEALDYVDIHFPYRYVFVEAIEALSRPSLSNLGEAAEEYSLDVKAKPYGNLVKEAFKGGATWRDAQIPSLPSNLDEAAEKYFEQYNYMPKGFVVDAFKAGAEWMAGQGWISVDERLPEMDEEVIVLSDELGTAPIYKISFGHIVDVNRRIDYNGWNIPEVKYWMPCPEIPGMND